MSNYDPKWMQWADANPWKAVLLVIVFVVCPILAIIASA